jgi:hypothetical protein
MYLGQFKSYVGVRPSSLQGLGGLQEMPPFWLVKPNGMLQRHVIPNLTMHPSNCDTELRSIHLGDDEMNQEMKCKNRKGLKI